MQVGNHPFKKESQKALHDPLLAKALDRLTTDGFVSKRKKAVDNFPEFDNVRDETIQMRNATLADLDKYLLQYESNVIKQGGQVHWALNAADANTIVNDICKSVYAKTILKSKSMVTEEIGLNDYLIKHGYDVLETDLGEYIIQQKQETPSHIVVPALHLDKESVAKTFKEKHTHLNADRPLETPRQMLDEVRALMREQFNKADVGITGANFLIADTGSGVIVSNEGNADLCQINADTHIVITGIEKVVPSISDVNPLLRLLARSATGQDTTTYVTISSGIEPKFIKPKNYHVILVDNGRSDMLKTEMRAMLRCIRCGACINHCPVYHAIGGQAYGSMYMGPMGAVLTPSLFGPNAVPDLPNASTFCGRCEQVCPMKIPLPDLMRDYRSIQFHEKYQSFISRTSIKAWAWLAKKPALYASVTNMMARTLKLLNKLVGNKGYFKHLLGATGWTKFRNFPAPMGKTFQSSYKKQKKKS